MRPYSAQYASTNKILSAGLIKVKLWLYEKETFKIRGVEILRYSNCAAETVAGTTGGVGTVVFIF